MNRFTSALAAALAAGALAAIPDDAPGCAPVWRHEQDGDRTYPGVTVADEAALIVWDDKTRTEHFVRRAHFRSTGYDFGFLVPTPTRPDLDLAGDDLFGELASITAPKIEYHEVVREVEKEFSLGCAGSKKSAEFAAEPTAKVGAPGGVEVLEQKRLGDYDAAILAFRKGDGDGARGGEELAKWLAKHGYESPPAVERWLQKYVDDGWCVTAFKIAAPGAKTDDAKADGPQPRAKIDDAKTADRRDVRAKPIRMSFKADRPFHPYREPETEPAARPQNESRLLRVFVAAPGRVAGRLGDGSKLWPGQTAWAGSVDAARWTGLFQKAKLIAPEPKDVKAAVETPKPADGYWLTEFEDRSSPRPGTDEVYFEPAADAAAVERPPVVINNVRTVMVTPWWHAAVYVAVPVALVLGGLILWRVLRRA